MLAEKDCDTLIALFHSINRREKSFVIINLKNSYPLIKKNMIVTLNFIY